MTILPKQSQEARSLLNWTQADLSNASSLDKASVERFENGIWETTPVVGHIIRRTLEAAGVEFISLQSRSGFEIRLKNET